MAQKKGQPKQPYHERVAEEVIKALEEGTAPWIKPWEPGQQPDRPTNALTGKPYRGWNSVYLSMMQKGDDPRWCTYKQAKELGAQVRKGEKGSVVQYWQFREKQLVKDDQGKPVLDDEGKKQYRNVELERPKVFHAVVFHASQIDGMPPLPPRKEKPEWERHQAAEQMLEASGASIHHDQNDRAFYRPSTDQIHLPPKGQFPSADNYYATALHEVGHWTGHPSRLDRDLSHPFGSEGYAKEELRAELSSYMLGTELGIGHDPGQHTAYIGSWIKALKEDPNEIFRASRDAEKIVDFMQGLVQEQEQTLEKAQVQEQLVAELEEASQEALEGYKSIDSWRNLEATAKSFGITATLARSEEEEGAMVVRYERDGEALPMQTELMPGDGKALTSVDGQRVEGTGFTSDPEWQSDALKKAITPMLVNQVEQRLETEMQVVPEMPAVRDFLEGMGDDERAINALNSLDNDPNPAREFIKGINAGVLNPQGMDALKKAQKELQDYAISHGQGPRWSVEEYIPGTADKQVILETNSPKEAMELFEKSVDRSVQDNYLGVAVAFVDWDGDSSKPEWKAGPTMRAALELESQGIGQAESAYINFLAAGLAEVRDGRMTGEGLNAVAMTMQVPGEYGVQPLLNAEIETWNGTTQVRGCQEFEDDNGEKYIEEAPAEEAQFFGVYVGQEDGRMMWHSDHPTQEQANAVSQRLEAIHTQAKVYQSREAQEQSQSRSQAQAREANSMETPKQEAQQQTAQEKTWLNVPYREKNEAKKHGARWDREAKSWYAPEGTNLAPLAKWLPENNAIRQEPPQDPRAEFAEALKDAGLKIDGMPQMDGKLHRVPVEGDEKGRTSGAYKGYLDGHPAGFIQNFKSGLKTNWKATGQRLNPAEIAKLEREAEAKRQAREREREATYNAKSEAITQELATLPDAPADHPYLQNKGLDAAGHAFGAKQDDQGNLVIPIEDKDGKVWSAQRIGPNGFKGYEKDAKVAGCYQVIGGKSALEAQDEHEPVLISTGFGTSASIHMATGRPVVVAFQDNNLEDVAKEFKQQYPERTIAILGDDDRHLPERTPPLPNSGREKATAAAKAVGGRALFPQFTAQEKGREFTDFSDLHRTRGLAAVQRQVEQGLAQARGKVNAQNQREQALEKAQERGKERDDQKRSRGPARGEARGLSL